MINGRGSKIMTLDHIRIKLIGLQRRYVFIQDHIGSTNFPIVVECIQSSNTIISDKELHCGTFYWKQTAV